MTTDVFLGIVAVTLYLIFVIALIWAFNGQDDLLEDDQEAL